MRWRLASLILGLTVAACGSSLRSNNDGGGGNGTGVGGASGGNVGIGGTTGGGGSAGSGGMAGWDKVIGVAGVGGTAALAACTLADDFPRLIAVGANGAEPSASIDGAVTVVSVDSCTAVDCGAYSSFSLRVVLGLQADDSRITLYSRSPGMPSTLVKAGDVLSLAFTPFDLVTPPITNHRRSLVLARQSVPVMFDAERPEDLVAYGITVGPGGYPCAWTNCYYSGGASVTYLGGEAKSVNAGGTVQIDALSISVDTIDRRSGLCDGPESFFEVAGFTSP